MSKGDISEVTLTRESLAAEVHSLAQAAYRLEAERIGRSDFPPLRESVLQLQQSADTFLVFRASAVIVGALSFAHAESSLVITRLVVSPAHLRKGIATALLTEVQRRAPSACINVMTAAANIPAVHLYQRLGYTRSRRAASSEGIELLHLTRGKDQPQEHMGANDPFDLSRFVEAHAPVFDIALAELRRGKKESHWMWFVFPQLSGLGTSSMANRYAIRSLDEAEAYLNHPVLGPRLLDCSRALLSLHGKSATEIMGSPDDLKLRSSMTLFSLVGSSHPESDEVLTKYFAGQHDERTIKLLKVADHDRRHPGLPAKRCQWHP